MLIYLFQLDEKKAIETGSQVSEKRKNFELKILFQTDFFSSLCQNLQYWLLVQGYSCLKLTDKVKKRKLNKLKQVRDNFSSKFHHQMALTQNSKLCWFPAQRVMLLKLLDNVTTKISKMRALQLKFVPFQLLRAQMCYEILLICRMSATC